MSYPKKIYIQTIVILVAISVVFSLVLGLSSYLSLRDSAKYGMILIFLLGFIYYPANTKIVNYLESLLLPKLDKKVDEAVNARRGYEGEDEVNSWLEDIVGKDNIIRNVQLPNCKFDMDAIIVSNKGIIVVEVKNFTNGVYFKNDEYYYKKNDRLQYVPPKDDPRYKLKNRAYGLWNYLSEKGYDFVNINKILVFSNGNVYWDGEIGTYIIKNKESLNKYLKDLRFDNNCTPEVCEKIKSLLKKHSKF